MTILNFGSLNIDRTYEVDQFVQAGQTVSTFNYQEFLGGKGLNQSVALARAGADVYHVGVVGHDGGDLKQALINNNIDATYLWEVEEHSGHTVIQIDSEGENAILFEAGSNFSLDREMIDEVFRKFKNEKILVLLQNEVSNVDYIIEQAAHEGHPVVFNPSPMNQEVLNLPLHLVNYFLINESEGQALSHKAAIEDVYTEMIKLYPESSTLLTLGSSGAKLYDQEKHYAVEAVKTQPVDTTAAGDTFTGYFLAGLIQGEDWDKVLQQAAMASSMAISKKGAMESIPGRAEVQKRLKENK
ncbi:MAG: ribokinase [Atopococcus tabaci]|uniref:Ribokinase n=1 Tax=Atopococcus tabaci TaxID=269774 RepID=A0AA43UBV3_9LACT|nr:ribokinase [Atopococcus tabaci]